MHGLIFSITLTHHCTDERVLRVSFVSVLKDKSTPRSSVLLEVILSTVGIWSGADFCSLCCPTQIWAVSHIKPGFMFRVNTSQDDRLPRFSGHVQIAQVPSRNEPDSAGELSYSYLFDTLENIGYQGYIGCEYKPQGECSCDLRNDYEKDLENSRN